MPYGTRAQTPVKEQSASRPVSTLGRLMEFAEPDPDDVCLGALHDAGSLATALAPRVRQVTVVDTSTPGTNAAQQYSRAPTVLFGHPRRPQPAGAAEHTAHTERTERTERTAHPARSAGHAMQPARSVPAGGLVTVQADPIALPYRDGSFSLVVCRSPAGRTDDRDRAMRELVRVCHPRGRLIVAEPVRTRHTPPERERLERMHDPGHAGTPSLAVLTELLTGAGADVRRLEVFTVERPIDPWLEDTDPYAAERIREALLDEIDGGECTGARPRLIGGELWFSQSWAYLAAQPVR